MATAVDTTSEPRASSPPAGLVTASLVGTAYVLAALAVVLYAIPALWAQYVAPSLSANNLLDYALWGTVEIAAVAALVWFGKSLAGANPPVGMRGGIFLMIAAAVLIAFIMIAIGLAVEGMPGQIATAVVGLGLLFGAYKFFTSPRGERWMVGLEEQGWFHSAPYKRVLGQKVRRLTILGFLLIGATGVYSLYFQGVLPEDWAISIPFTLKDDGSPEKFVVLKGAKYAIPIVLIGLTLWLAYRAVNVPTFAEFLIATEAEMNKVSWTSRKRLTQDTIVVLATTILMALFLLVVDLFWGWLLSWHYVGVLPAKPTDRQKGGQVQEAKW